ILERTGEVARGRVEASEERVGIVADVGNTGVKQLGQIAAGRGEASQQLFAALIDGVGNRAARLADACGEGLSRAAERSDATRQLTGKILRRGVEACKQLFANGREGACDRSADILDPAEKARNGLRQVGDAAVEKAGKVGGRACQMVAEGGRLLLKCGLNGLTGVVDPADDFLARLAKRRGKLLRCRVDAAADLVAGGSKFHLQDRMSIRDGGANALGVTDDAFSL